MLDDVHQEIMEMHCQETFDTECKRIELKVKLNSLYENECNVIDYGHLKKMHDAIISYGKEVVKSCPLDKVLLKEWIEWCDCDCYYQIIHHLLNLPKLKLVSKKKEMQFEKLF